MQRTGGDEIKIWPAQLLAYMFDAQDSRERGAVQAEYTKWPQTKKTEQSSQKNASEVGLEVRSQTREHPEGSEGAARSTKS